jgi:exopolyphosphatase / guanosine-5'-triphosphate,3'-diphosphate pyrophosphatase
MNDPLAIIDLGTNTFHLLIAEKVGDQYRVVHREKQAVKLGMGGINHNRITEEALERAIKTISLFKAKTDALQISKVFAFGTSALRSVHNQQDVLEKIQAKTGIAVSVISGDQEAEFIYYGIRAALDLGLSKSLIVDIGGGSVEFIIGNNKEISWKRSYEIGGQRLLELFQNNDPIKASEINALNHHFAATLTEVFEQLNVHKPQTLIGSSGTFDTLSDIFCLKENISKQEDDPETPLTMAGFYKIYNELITKNRTQRLAMPGMIEMRVDMIVVACCLIRFIVENYPFTAIRVSGYSLKEGALHYLAGTIS